MSWIYSHSLDAAYYPICKAGCTSITAALLMADGVIDRMPEGDGSEVHRMLWYPMGKANAVLIKGLACRVKDAGAKPPSRAFTFVRHPFARMASCYRDKVCSEANWLGTAQGLRVQPFSAFVRVVCESDPASIDLHVRPQTTILHDASLAFIGKTDRFADDWERLADAWGWPVLRLPRLNKTAGGDWRDAFDAETVTLARRYYREDFERFDYAV